MRAPALDDHVIISCHASAFSAQFKSSFTLCTTFDTLILGCYTQSVLTQLLIARTSKNPKYYSAHQ